MLASIFGWTDVQTALRYTHATDEARSKKFGQKHSDA